jgi:hypothetical protein
VSSSPTLPEPFNMPDPLGLVYLIPSGDYGVAVPATPLFGAETREREREEYHDEGAQNHTQTLGTWPLVNISRRESGK